MAYDSCLSQVCSEVKWTLVLALIYCQPKYELFTLKGKRGADNELKISRLLGH